MTNLRSILQAYQRGERGLPEYYELINIAASHDELLRQFIELATGKHNEQRNIIRDNFERDCT